MIKDDKREKERERVQVGEADERQSKKGVERGREGDNGEVERKKERENCETRGEKVMSKQEEL